MDPEIRAQFEETRRHFDVVAEGMRSDVRLVAEGVSSLAERVDRVEENLREEIRQTRTDLTALITVSYGDLDRRVRRLGPPLLAGRRAAQAPRRRLDLRPRDVRPGSPARRRDQDGLARRAAQGRRSRRLLLLLPVRPLLRLPEQRARLLPQQGGTPARTPHLSPLPRRLRPVLLPPPRRLPLQGPRRALRRNRRAGELRALPGDLRRDDLVGELV